MLKKDVLRMIAIFEAVKGLAVLAASVGVISLLHKDLHHLALELLAHFNINPEAHYPSLLLHYAEIINNTNARSIVLVALAYACLRSFEAYGLWHDFAWAEWLGAMSGIIYIPFEITHLMHRISGLGVALFFGNIFVISFLIFRLFHRHRRIKPSFLQFRSRQ